MSTGGWIKIYRNIVDNQLYFAEPFTRMQAWIDLLILANYEDGFIYLRGCKVAVNRGQICKSQDSLAERWRWSRGKVVRFLDELQKDGYIVQQKNRLTTLISVSNFDFYQQAVQQIDQQIDQQIVQPYIKKNKKNNIISPYNPPEGDLGEFGKSKKEEDINYQGVADYFNKTFEGKLSKVEVLSDGRKKDIKARISSYGKESIAKVFQNILQSSFLLGDNDRNWKANFDWIFKASNFVKIMEGNYLKQKNETTETKRYDNGDFLR